MKRFYQYAFSLVLISLCNLSFASENESSGISGIYQPRDLVEELAVSHYETNEGVKEITTLAESNGEDITKILKDINALWNHSERVNAKVKGLADVVMKQRSKLKKHKKLIKESIYDIDLLMNKSENLKRKLKEALSKKRKLYPSQKTVNELRLKVKKLKNDDTN